MKWRIACAWVPNFAIQLSTRQLPQTAQSAPTVLIGRTLPNRVMAMNRRAEEEGLFIGQTATRATASTPDLNCLFWDEDLIESSAKSLGKELLNAAPHVVPMGNQMGTYWIDARGMGHLGGESAFANRVLTIGAELGHPNIRVGIANTAQTAYAAAFHTSAEEPVVIIPDEKEEEFREKLPLTQLSISPEIQQTLVGLGITHVDQLNLLSPAHLESRFGQEGLQAWRAARGEDHRRINARPDSHLCSSTLCLDTPVDGASSLIFGLKHMATELAGRLREECRAASALRLILALDDHSEHHEVLYPARPTLKGASIFELVRDRLEHLSRPLSSPIVELTLLAHETVHADPDQVHMGQHRWDPQAVERALDRLQGRFGDSIIFEAQSRTDYRPEYAGDWRPIHQVPVQSSPAHLHTTDRLSAPEPMRRQFDSPIPVHIRINEEDRPIEMRWQAEWIKIDARGPQRISGAWWQSAAYAYEDYSIALPSQEVLWLRHDAVHQLWTLNGWFD